MKMINGKHMNPYEGNVYDNGMMLGRAIAELHSVIGKIGENFNCHDADYIIDLNKWIIPKLNGGGVVIFAEIVNYCRSFGALYHTLPRHLIHRDIHMHNMVFSDGVFAGWLDFDNAERNVRLHDLCYLGAMMLVDKWRNKNDAAVWRSIFRGVLDGYSEVFELTVNELAAIPYMFVFIELTFTAFFAGLGQMDIAVNCMEMTEWFYNEREQCFP
jgi:aminoglycoside phosphotransferase (APT) family kinase protein